MISEAVAQRPALERGTKVAGTNFEDGYPELYRSAYRVAFRLLGAREEAADLAQEACARAYARWNRIGGYERPDAWTARVAGNLALDALRKRGVVARHAPDDPGYARPPDAARVDLTRALLALPRRQREVVLLRYVADQSEAAVAVALGCSVGSVKAYASRGLAALRAQLGEDRS